MIRLAKKKDVEKILDLLLQVDLVHHNGRPDLFKVGTKYNKIELNDMLEDINNPIFVAVDEKDVVTGYCFCNITNVNDNAVLISNKRLYIDDLCVDENLRGKGIGKALYNYVKNYAKEIGCYNLTLNVWSCNKDAIAFYNSLGLTPFKIGMETIL